MEENVFIAQFDVLQFDMFNFLNDGQLDHVAFIVVSDQEETSHPLKSSSVNARQFCHVFAREVGLHPLTSHVETSKVSRERQP